MHSFKLCIELNTFYKVLSYHKEGSKWKSTRLEFIMRYASTTTGLSILLPKKRIDEMPLIDVLNAYLTWEGILGYTSDILSIFGYDKEGNKCM